MGGHLHVRHSPGVPRQAPYHPSDVNCGCLADESQALAGRVRRGTVLALAGRKAVVIGHLRRLRHWLDDRNWAGG